MNTNWTNYGDVNPIEHGGVWIKPDIIENCFYVITNIPISENTQLFQDLYVDVAASWIDWETVNSCFGESENESDIDKVIKLIRYSSVEFGTEKVIETQELIEELKKYDIIVEG